MKMICGTKTGKKSEGKEGKKTKRQQRIWKFRCAPFFRSAYNDFAKKELSVLLKMPYKRKADETEEKKQQKTKETKLKT